MKHLSLSLLAAIVLTLGAQAASAACQAEYKAKRDNPLELYYDVVEVNGPCTVENAEAQLRASLASEGLVLLKVLSVVES